MWADAMRREASTGDAIAGASQVASICKCIDLHVD
jgi:hypothetical protein